MASENGSRPWLMWLAGIVATILTSAMFMLGSNVIANDQDSRNRDDVLENKLVSICEKQQDINSKILVKLASIETELKYRNGRTAN